MVDFSPMSQHQSDNLLNNVSLLHDIVVQSSHVNLHVVSFQCHVNAREFRQPSLSHFDLCLRVQLMTVANGPKMVIVMFHGKIEFYKH